MKKLLLPILLLGATTQKCIETKDVALGAASWVFYCILAKITLDSAKNLDTGKKNIKNSFLMFSSLGACSALSVFIEDLKINNKDTIAHYFAAAGLVSGILLHKAEQ